jgi:ribA/ribD-fused uncharacterized protein
VTAITSFRGEHFFLSNYYQYPFMWRTISFPTGEHAFAAAKVLATDLKPSDKYVKMVEFRKAHSPGHAKSMGRSLKIDVDKWESIKVEQMQQITRAKFAHPELQEKLLSTGYAMLVEGNDWGDKIWGRVYENGKWVGQNLLGVILMETRGRLR